MEIGILIVSVILWCWFLGCTITYRFKNIILVEGMGVKSAEFIMLITFTFGVMMWLTNILMGKWVSRCICKGER